MFLARNALFRRICNIGQQAMSVSNTATFSAKFNGKKMERKRKSFEMKPIRENDESSSWNGIQNLNEKEEIYNKEELIPNSEMIPRILSNLKKTGITFIIPGNESFAREELIKSFEYLIDHGVKPEFIIDGNSKNAQLFRCFVSHPEQSVKIIETIVNFGFVTYEDSIRLFSLFPDELINYGVEKLEKNLESLPACGIITARSIQSAIRRCPPLLFARQPEQMTKLAHEIGGFFSRRQANQLISRCPHILLKSIEEIEEKYEYVFYQMGGDAEEFSESSAWIDELDLDEMAMRHKFLTMCGKYSMPDAKRPQIRRENPKIMRIFDSNDEDFAGNVAHVSIEEWNVFKSLEWKRRENENKERKFERVKPSKRKAYERRHKRQEILDEHVFDVSSLSAAAVNH